MPLPLCYCAVRDPTVRWERFLACYVLLWCAVSESEDCGPPAPGSPFLPFTGEHGEPLAIWVASAIEKIPPGSLIINPQTGKPYLNPDGSVYRWYPPTDRLAVTSAASRSSPVDQGKVCYYFFYYYYLLLLNKVSK